MGLSDIITTPFLLCLGICFLLIGLLGYYFIQKINEQNHKMNSMLDLITTIANELNNVNARLHSVPVGAVQNYQTTDLNQSPNNMLIPVSDDENDDINIGSEDESDDEEEGDEEEDDDEEDDNGKSFIKSINIGNVLNFNFDDAKLNEDKDDDEHEDDDEDEDEDEDENYNNNDSDSVSISSEKEGDLDSEEENEDEERDKEKSFEENPIQITDLEEIKESLKIDYKKFALNKLRSMVIDKGFTSDASKLKKQDLIKLLEEN
jgi:hypothetical protein